MKAASFILLLAALVLPGCQPAAKTPAKTDTVAQVGALRDLKSGKTEKVQDFSWGQPLPESVRFVVVSKDEALDEAKKKQIGDWISGKKVVAFYGNGVKPESFKEKTGIDAPVANPQGSVPLKIYLYGYGYSPASGANLALFYASNADAANPAQSVVDYLGKQESEF